MIHYLEENLLSLYKISGVKEGLSIQVVKNWSAPAMTLSPAQFTFCYSYKFDLLFLTGLTYCEACRVPEVKKYKQPNSRSY